MSNTNQPSNGQNTFNKINVSTNSLTLFDENGTMFKLGFLNETLSVMLCAPVVSPEGKRTYPTEARVNFIITADRVASLHNNIIMEKVLDAVAENRNYNGGIFLDVKKNRVFEIRVQDGEVYAIYYIDIDAERHPKRTIVYKFSKSPIIEKYNPESGDFEMPEAHSQFYLFTKTLDGFLECINGINTHSHRYTNKYVTDKVFKMLEDISIKLGITITPSKSPSWGNSNGSVSEESMPSMTETTDLNSLLLS